MVITFEEEIAPVGFLVESFSDPYSKLVRHGIHLQLIAPDL